MSKLLDKSNKFL